MTSARTPRSVAILGNVGPDSPSFSTENEWRRAYESHGVGTYLFTEDDSEDWIRLSLLLKSQDRPDYVQWTSTPAKRAKIPQDIQRELLNLGTRQNVPIVGIHLDRFWGIKERERWIQYKDPYFQCHVLFTADGGNQARWDGIGANHRWLLPAVAEQWCKRGQVREEFQAPVAFVGSWSKYHSESKHRAELISWIQRNVRGVKLWPRKHFPAIREDDLTDLYWSTDVMIGDSFFPSRGQHQPTPNYSSDRIPESLGRGAMLLHPNVSGITDGPFAAPNLSTWTAWHWRELRRKIEESLDMNPSVRTRKRNAGIKYIRENHTYEHRVLEVWDALQEEGLV